MVHVYACVSVCISMCVYECVMCVCCMYVGLSLCVTLPLSLSLSVSEDPLGPSTETSPALAGDQSQVCRAGAELH